MKRIKYYAALFLMAATIPVISRPTREIPAYASQNQQESNYHLKSEDTIVIYKNYWQVRDESVLATFANVKHIVFALPESVLDFRVCQYFPNIESIYIPKNITSLDFGIDGNEFAPKLKEFIVDEGNIAFVSDHGILYNKSKKS